MTPSPSREVEWARRLGLVLASLLVSLLLLEFACRAWRGPEALLDWSNLSRRGERDLAYWNARLFTYHPLLGAVPGVDRHSPAINTDGEGYRLTPGLMADAAQDDPVVAVGDSYTFGNDVEDGGAWPAHLQFLTHRRIVNAGVPGYGLDQTVLRAELTAKAQRAALVVVSFIADDLWRMEMHRLWAVEKPYFVLEQDGALALRNVPPPRRKAGEDHLSFWQHAFGWSVLIDTVQQRLLWHDEWTTDSARALPPGTAKQLTYPLMQRLAQLGIPTVVVAQYEPFAWQPGRAAYKAEQRALSSLVLRCADQAGLATLDTYSAVGRAVAGRGLDAIYIGEHHTAEGNRLVARAIAAEIDRRGLIAR